MKFNVAQDARPQVYVLLLAAAISLALWFIPFSSWLVYPIELFVTFIHEGGHVLAALLTGSSVQSMSVAPDASGLTFSSGSTGIFAIIKSSAGYIGAVSFGALLLILIRKGVRPNIVLFFCSILIATLTVVFGFLAPVLNIFSGETSIFSVAFTLLAGGFIAAMLFLAARFTRGWWANFILSFLAVQCLLNAFYDLRVLFYISTTAPYEHSDALNLANATGVPSIVWVLLWLGISVAITALALRVYSYGRSAGTSAATPFDIPAV
jgi:hypothetical protein